MSETRKDAVSERARMLRAEDELSKAIGALPLPWGDSALDAPLARIREAINALAATPPTPDRAAVREASLDERIAAEDHGCGVNCGACVSQCGDAPRGLSFEDAVVRRGLINALRFASTEQAVRELDEFARTLGVAECGEGESPLAFHIRIADALLAAVSRPAEARGEPEYLALADRNGHIITTRKASEGAENILAQFPADEFPNHAPSGGEAHTDCAELDDVVREVFCRVFGDDGDAGLSEIEKWHEWYKPSDWLWWGRGLGTFLEKRIEERAGAMAAPRPEPGEVTEAMVEAGARALHDGLESGVAWDNLFPSMQDVNRKASHDVLRAALSAQREPKP